VQQNREFEWSQEKNLEAAPGHGTASIDRHFRFYVIAAPIAWPTRSTFQSASSRNARPPVRHDERGIANGFVLNFAGNVLGPFDDAVS